MRKWAGMFKSLKNTHFEQHGNSGNFVKSTQEFVKNRALSQNVEFQQKLAQKYNQQRQDLKKQVKYSTGGSFSLSAGLENAKNFLQTLIGSVSTGFKRLGFGISNIFTGGNQLEDKVRPTMRPGQNPPQQKDIAQEQSKQSRQSLFAQSMTGAKPKAMDKEEQQEPLSEAEAMFLKQRMRKQGASEDDIRARLFPNPQPKIKKASDPVKKATMKTKTQSTTQNMKSKPKYKNQQKQEVGFFSGLEKFFSNVGTKVRKLVADVGKKIEGLKSSVMDFIEDLRSNGFTKTKERLTKGFKENVLVHFESRENFSQLIKTIGEKLSLQNAINRVNNYMETLNDRLFGINQKKKGNEQMQGESPYWKQLTGKSKQQFLYAAKKERAEFLLYGTADLRNFDINLLNQDPNQKYELRPITYWDKLRIKFTKIEQGVYRGIFNMLTSDLPSKIRENVQDWSHSSKTQVEEGIVLFHERYVSGSGFADENSNSRKWHHRFFNRKGEYADNNDRYRKQILQQYFNYSIFFGLTVSAFIISKKVFRTTEVEIWEPKAQTKQQSEQSPELVHQEAVADVSSKQSLLHQLRVLKLEVEKLKLERQQMKIRQELVESKVAQP